MILRDYQQTAVNESETALRDNKSTLLVMATGTGKTIVFGHLIRNLLDANPGQRALILAHRKELIWQARDKIGRVCDVRPDIEMGKHYASRELFPSPIIISTIQTQISGVNGLGRMTHFDPQQFGYLVFDEGHHALADSWRRTLQYYSTNPDLRTIFVTATPDRADELALGAICDSVAFEYRINQAVDNGWLVKPRQRMISIDSLDFSKCDEARLTGGDLNGRALAELMEDHKNVMAIADVILEKYDKRTTLVFAASIAQAEAYRDIFNSHQAGCARIITHRTPDDERKELMRDYRARRFPILVNVAVATEGFDVLPIAVIAMARPTMSRALCEQMLGRGTRPLEGIVDDPALAIDSEARKAAIARSDKPHFDVLDFVGNSRHKLVSAIDVLGGQWPDEVCERAVKLVRDSNKNWDPDDALRKAQQELAREKREAEERRRQRLFSGVTTTTRYTEEEVNPFERFGLTPFRVPAWHRGREATPNQKEFLAKRRINADGLSFVHASQLIDHIKNELDGGGPVTVKQAPLLRRYGYTPAQIANGTCEWASEQIDAIARNGWKRPRRQKVG